MKHLKAIFVLVMFCAVAQAQPFIKEVTAFKKQDSISFPGTGKILFIGSSSFTLWKDVQNDFPEYQIVNRAFGGSTLLDVTRYEQDIIFRYKPKQIIIYCGENDVAGDSIVTGKIVFERFKKLYTDIRSNLGNVPIVFVGMKPSPSRWHMRARTIEGNRQIEKFLKRKKNNGKFLSVWNAMLNADGTPREELFIGDQLHMNKEGYKIWQKIIQPYLIK